MLHSRLSGLEAVPSQRGTTHTFEQVDQHKRAPISTSSHHGKTQHISVQRRLKLMHAPGSAVDAKSAFVPRGSCLAALTTRACTASLKLTNSKKYPGRPRLNAVSLGIITLLAAKPNELVMGHRSDQIQLGFEPSMVPSSAPH